MRKPGSPTGNSLSRNRGFTLLEVLLAVVVIAMGASVLLPALTRPAQILAHLQHRSEALWVAGNVLADAETHFRKYGSMAGWSGTGRRPMGAGEYELDVRLGDPGYGARVCSVEVSVSWTDQKENRLTRHELINR